MKVWSELPRRRAVEMMADVATAAWLILWSSIGGQVFHALAQLAEAGRIVRDGGTNLGVAGDRLAGAVQGVPLFGEGVAGGIRGAFTDAARPLIEFGAEIERVIVVIAALLAVLVVAVAVVPWLSRYLPWRIGRLGRLRAARRVVRRVPAGSDNAEVVRLLASRALHRLDYAELLDYSADPFGDWIAGRHEQLARAELASVGLRLTR